MNIRKRIIRLQKEKEQLKEKQKELEEQEQLLQEKCQHEKVYVMIDNTPHKVGPIAIYYCPLCEKEIRVPIHQVEELPFANSNIEYLGQINIQELLSIKNNLKEEITRGLYQKVKK